MIAMTLEIELSSELESRLSLEANRRGISTDRAAIELLDRHLPDSKQAKAAAMLLRWADEAEALSDVEAEANAAVLRSIDEDRLSERKLFEDLPGSSS